MTAKIFVLVHAMARKLALEAVRDAPEGKVVTIREKTRSLEQNSKMWAMLAEISEQVIWYGQKLSPEDWKTVFTASLRKSGSIPGLDPNTMVPLGLQTSTLTVAEMSDLLELMHAFAAEQGVKFADGFEWP